MRCIILGNKNLAIGCIEVLFDRGHEILGIVLNPNDDGVDRHGYRSLKRWAAERNLPVIQPDTANAEGGVEWVRSRPPDALFSFSYLRILKGEILAIPHIGAFNIHFGYLPQHRGNLPLVYAMAANEPFAGVTLHLMDEGIDSGDVVGETSVPILKHDTAKSLYFKCVDAGIDLFARTLPAIAGGHFDRLPQAALETKRGHTYHPMRYPNDRWIDWTRSDEEIDAFIRAHSFPPYPGARFNLRDRVLEVVSDGARYHADGRACRSLDEVKHVL